MHILVWGEHAASVAQSTVTLVAAAIGGVAGVVAAILGALAASRARQWTGRTHWWERFTWACERVDGKQPGDVELGLHVLASLIEVRWANSQDNEMAARAMNVILEHYVEGRAARRRVR